MCVQIIVQYIKIQTEENSAASVHKIGIPKQQIFIY